MTLDSTLDRDSYALALLFERILTGHDGATVVKACNWVLAALIIQASQAQVSSVDRGISTCIDVLIDCTARLASEGLPRVAS